MYSQHVTQIYGLIQIYVSNLYLKNLNYRKEKICFCLLNFAKPRNEEEEEC